MTRKESGTGPCFVWYAKYEHLTCQILTVHHCATIFNQNFSELFDKWFKPRRSQTGIIHKVKTLKRNSVQQNKTQ